MINTGTTASVVAIKRKVMLALHHDYHIAIKNI